MPTRMSALSLEVEDGTALSFGVYVIRAAHGHRAADCCGRRSCFTNSSAALTPKTCCCEQVTLPAGARPQDLTLRVLDDGAELLSLHAAAG